MAAETEVTTGLPRKKYFRQRAHSNPLGDHCVDYPVHPDKMDWSSYYPKYINKKGENVNGQVTFTDVLSFVII